MSHRDRADLDKFFSLAGREQRSIQGEALARAYLMSVQLPKSDEPITARPTAEVKRQPCVEVDEELMELIGRVSTRLRMLPPRLQAVLTAHYGDDGACCAERMKRYGRVVSVMRFTPAGRKLLAREKRVAAKLNAKLKVTPTQLMQNAVGRSAAEAATTDAQVIEAHVQALELLRQAEQAYADAAHSQSRKPVRGLRKVVG